MRKFTLLFAFLLSLIGVAQAQTVITDLANLSNEKTYVLSTERGTLQVNNDGTELIVVAAANNEESKQHFAILKTVFGTYHLYSVSEQKFVDGKTLKDDLLTREDVANTVILFEEHKPEGTSSGKFMLKKGSNYYNMDNSQNLFVDGWSTHDGGNGFTFTEVGDLENAVEVLAKVQKLPEVSTIEAPKYYSIQNIRGGSYVSALLSSGNRLSLTTTLQLEGFFYFTDASAAVQDALPEGAKAVYIHNVSTNKVLAGHTQNPWGDTGTVYYLVPAKQINTNNLNGYVITKSLTDLGSGSSWNNYQNKNTEVDSWNADDMNSIWWVDARTAQELETLLSDALLSIKDAAIVEAQAEGARAYYACSEGNVNACLATINAQEVTSYESLVTAKENIATALSTLKATERVRPLQGGETVIFENRNNPTHYLSTNAVDATGETEAVEASEVKWYTTQDLKSLWEVIAVGDGTFKLRNALSGKYIQHLENDNNLKLLSVEEATPYVLTNQDLHYILIGAEGFNNRKYINHRGNNNISSWGDANDKGNQWNVIVPAQDLLDELNNLRTPLADLQAEAIATANARVAEIEDSDEALEFYTYDAAKIAELRTTIEGMINAVTTHAELSVVEAEVNALLDAFIVNPANRTNPVQAGDQLKFQNKAITKYMVSEVAGVNTAEDATSASVWMLVDDDDENTAGYYLYNPLNNTYVKHAARNGQQATLVADKAQATLYEVIPAGTYVLIRETTENDYNEDYLHTDETNNFVTRWLDSHDRSLWTVTSATEAELSQLATDITTAVTTQLTTAVNAANAVVAPYEALEFYRPTTAIDTYKTAIAAAIADVDTYEELTVALAAVESAKSAFEAAIAADDVVLANPVSDGVQVKFFNRQHSTYITVTGDGAEMSASLNFEAGAVWTLKAATNGGFYLYSPVVNAYAKHPTGNDKPLALVSSSEDASIYYVHSNGLYVTVGTLAEQSTEENSLDYLHGVNWVGYQKGYNVVRWNAVAQASHWTISNVTPEELAQANNAMKEYVEEELEAYKASAQETVDAMAALTYYKATAEAISAYNEAVASLTATSYEDLVVAKAKVDDALAEFMVAPRDANTALPANTRVKFVNKANPTLWMTTDAGGVTASGVVGLESHWVLKASAAGNGFYLYNEMSGKYVKHPVENGAQATLVSEETQATSYEIEPNGLFVLLKDATENTYDEDYLHYGSERYVTRWLANNDASLWNFEVVTDDEFKELIAHQLDSCKQLALLRISVATKAAFYAPTSEAINVAKTAVEAIDVQANSTISGYASALNSINAAMTVMYNNGLTNGATPKGSTKYIRLRNKLYPTHYLGFGENGLYHYETVTTENSVAPVDEEMSVGTVDILHSTESTVWALEDPIVAAADERMYLKNLMIQSYAKHQFYDGSHVQHVIEKAETSPEIIELVGVVKDANHNKTIKYEDMSFVESGEMCFVVYATEGTSNTVNNAMSASERGTIVNAAHTIDASMWAISEAAEVELANMGQYSAYAFHHYVFVPTINAAKQFYCITTEGEGDAAVTTTVDYIDPVKAGYYHYTGGCVDREGAEIVPGDYETFEQEYWYALSTAIALDQNSEEGGHELSKAQTLVTTLNEYMKALLLNFPTRDGFFRLRCVETNAYLQSDVNTSGRCVVSNNTDVSSIFYYDAIEEEGKEGQGSLLSYRDGYYFTQGKNSQNISGIYAKLQPLGKMGDIFQFSRPQNKEFGSYNISSDNTSNQNDRRYMFGAAGNETDGYYVDNGAGATIVSVASDGDNTGYNWVMERVEELPLTINSYGYSTFYAPIALNVPEGVEAFICAGVDEKSELILQKLDVIPAGTAVILKAEELAGQVVYFTEPENTPMPLAEGENYLHGGVYKTWRTPACQNKNPEMTSATGENADLPYLDEAVGDNVYTLSNKNGKVAMYLYAGNKYTHFRSFLKMPAAVNGTLPTTFNFGDIIEGPTSIEETPVVSLEDAVIYDLSGRRVAEPGKGIYIVNGKKVYIK